MEECGLGADKQLLMQIAKKPLDDDNNRRKEDKFQKPWRLHVAIRPPAVVIHFLCELRAISHSPWISLRFDYPGCSIDDLP